MRIHKRDHGNTANAGVLLAKDPSKRIKLLNQRLQLFCTAVHCFV